MRNVIEFVSFGLIVFMVFAVTEATIAWIRRKNQRKSR